MLRWYEKGTIPEILEPEEEKEYILRMKKDGDRKARQMLIMHNLRLAVWTAEKYKCGEQEQEDLMSVATIGLIKAVDTFNPSFRSRISTYAVKCIKYEILMYLRKMNQVRSREDCVPDFCAYLMKAGDSTEREAVENLCREELMDAMNNLPAADRELLKRRYGLSSGMRLCSSAGGISQEEAARALGISQSCLSRKERRILRRLRRCLDGTVDQGSLH